MDRNNGQGFAQTQYIVALRKESVDRNHLRGLHQQVVDVSLSVRRAWIEIPRTVAAWEIVIVALRKESVDRNIGRESGLRVRL